MASSRPERPPRAAMLDALIRLVPAGMVGVNRPVLTEALLARARAMADRAEAPIPPEAVDALPAAEATRLLVRLYDGGQLYRLWPADPRRGPAKKW